MVAREAMAIRAWRPRRLRLAAQGLRRLWGSSNPLFALHYGRRDYILKLYAAEEQAGLSPLARAEREWQALALLEAQHVRCAPRPVYFESPPDSPAIVMTRVPGRAIRPARLTEALLVALADALRELHRVTPEHAPGTTLPVLTDMAAGRHWFAGRIADLGGPDPPPAAREARALGEAWLAGPDWAVLLAPMPLAFSRADANLANCLWDGRRIAIVDYEYCGWRDRTWDLADPIEADCAWSFAKGVAPTPDAAWASFLARGELSAAERERFLAVQRWLAWIWTVRAWEAFAADPSPLAQARFTAHLKRMRHLCR